MIQKALACGFIFLAAPLGMGLLPIRFMKEKRKRLTTVYLAGFLMELALFQLVAVPVVVSDPWGFPTIVTIYSILLFVLMAAGFGWAVYGNLRLNTPVFSLKNWLRSLKKNGKKLSMETLAFWALAIACVLFQMYMAYAYASFDGDDAYYVAQSVITEQTNTLYRILPYTGLTTELDIRHALAVLPLWEAYVARLSGIHAAIVAHTLLPLVIIPVTYLLYFCIGRLLFKATGVKLPVFMTLVGIMQIFGNSSIYTNATFFLMRTWQGKALMANLVVLALFWILLELCSKEIQGNKRGWWFLLVTVNIVSALVTTMGTFLAALLIGIIGLVTAVRDRDFMMLLKLGICCIPNLVYLVAMVLIG